MSKERLMKRVSIKSKVINHEHFFKPLDFLQVLVNRQFFVSKWFKLEN